MEFVPTTFLFCSNKKNIGPCGGQVVSMLHFYSEFESRCVKIVVDKVENKQKEASISPFKNICRKKSGFCVYLAYQLWDNVTYDQMVGESINRGVDISAKKKQLVGSLNEAKLAPQNDERVRWRPRLDFCRKMDCQWPLPNSSKLNFQNTSAAKLRQDFDEWFKYSMSF